MNDELQEGPDGAIRVHGIRTHRSRRRGRAVFWSLLALAVALSAGGTYSLFSGLQRYFVPSATMANTIRPGQHILIRADTELRRGDIVVFRRPREIPDFVKRVIGLPGDHVRCCDAGGRVTVNGHPLTETYLYPGDAPSTVRFSVTLKPGKIWVMGDHRSQSIDSRPQPGIPGATFGPIALTQVVGRVVAVGNGSSYGQVRTPATFVAQGLAPSDDRGMLGSPLPLDVGAVALLVLAVFGIVRFARRHG